MICHANTNSVPTHVIVYLAAAATKNCKNQGAVVVNALPVGLAVGVLLVHWLETSPMNRKIWYATLLIIAIVSYFLPAGIVI